MFWKSLFFGIFLKKEKSPTNQFLINELKRHPYLRQACRIEPKVKKDGTKQLAPDKSVFTRFKQRLENHMEFLANIFEELREELKETLPNFGENLVLDGKIIESYANRPTKEHKKDGVGIQKVAIKRDTNPRVFN